MHIASVYFTYLVISVALTIWVARTLHKNGRVFLVDAFHGNEPLADAVNHLLVVGFYLVNLGYITMALRTYEAMLSLREIIEVESYKIGVVTLILGAMHLFNIMVFAKMRNRAKQWSYRDQQQPSITPSWPPAPAAEGARHSS